MGEATDLQGWLAVSGAQSHYFDDDPSAPSAPAEVVLALPDLRFVLDSDRGVFGYGHIDAGSKLLLLHAPPPTPEGNLLDLGCGYGPIALTLAARAPRATVWAVDVNERARQLCARNAARHGLDNIRVCAPDEVPPDLRFTTIWSNPAIRIGKTALHDMLRRWFDRLDGEAVMVVHKHLGGDSLQRWLNDQGWPTTRLTTGGGYRILRTVVGN